MCEETKFYICKHCGNLVSMIHSSGAVMVCCGDEMTEIIPNTVDADNEKHLPVVAISGDVVQVDIGSKTHPMTPEHYIQWVYLKTEKGCQRICLSHNDAPKAIFKLIEDDKPIAAYAYCNIHGLWKTDI